MGSVQAGDRLGRYEIVAPLGAGGMGEVYRARDKRLERDVAIKVLPPEVARDPERIERFEREAKATAALAHPNILEIHDFCTDAEITYAVTELLEGQTLRAAIASGILSECEAAEIGRQIADGLAAAHSRGVIHRDIKPDNVFLTGDGRVKVLDFGLAKLRPATPVLDEEDELPTELLVSQPGTVMGTPGYMAPEQLRGSPVDHRSDIFAVGCVIYEMLSGRRAFDGKTAPEIAANVLQAEPQRLDDVGPGLARVVERCLEKEPVDRFSSARELEAALRRVESPTIGETKTPERRRKWQVHAPVIIAAAVVAALFVLPPEGLWQRLTGTTEEAVIRSIAVLPLVNLSGTPDDDYFADGMTDELIMNLAKIDALDVISRTTAMHYKESDRPLPLIARELGVDAIIEGTVLRSDDSIRITVQLIHGATDKHLWAESYQRPLRDVLRLQSDVARMVAREVNITLTPDEERRLAQTAPVDPIAYDALMKGMHQFLLFTGPGFRKARNYFEKAISVDPGYADAHAALAAVQLNSTFFLSLPPSATVPAAKEANGTALELDPANGAAVLNRAWIEMTYDWDWQASERSHLQALEINPGWGYAHSNYGYMLASVGRFDEAISHVRRAERLDPLSLVIGQNVGWMLYHARRFDDAIAQLQKTVELNPQFWFTYQRMAHVFLAMGDYDKGIEAARRGIELAGPGTPRNGRAVLAQLLAASGRRPEAEAILTEFLDIEARQYLPPTDIARIHAALGNTDEAFRWLEKAVVAHDADLFMTKVWPAWDALRDDPRFDDLLGRLNLSSN